MMALVLGLAIAANPPPAHQDAQGCLQDLRLVLDQRDRCQSDLASLETYTVELETENDALRRVLEEPPPPDRSKFWSGFVVGGLVLGTVSAVASIALVVSRD
jgi:hypothetical protein